MKRQPTEWEKIFASDVTDRGFMFKIYKQLMQLNIKTHTHTHKQPNQKMGKRPKYTFLQRHKIAKKHMKRCSTSLIIREMQIKTIVRYYLTPIRMAIIKKSMNKFWRGCGERGTLLHCWQECKLVQPL